MYILIFIVLIGCHGGQSCFVQSTVQDIVGIWTINDKNIDHQVEFKSNGSGTAQGIGYFAPMINSDRANNFTWDLPTENRLQITWTNMNQEKARADLQVLKSTCKHLNLSDPITDQKMVLKRN